jgi:hypothetical protein
MLRSIFSTSYMAVLKQRISTYHFISPPALELISDVYDPSLFLWSISSWYMNGTFEKTDLNSTWKRIGSHNNRPYLIVDISFSYLPNSWGAVCHDKSVGI